jgi:predicted RecA/RadA family phage recombinase
MKNYIQPGKILTLVAPYTVASGAGAMVDAIFGVATVDITNGSPGEFQIDGVFDLAKTSAQAWTQGQIIYWDNTNKRCDSNSALGPEIGVATEIAANPTSTGKVRLNGIGVSRDEFVESEGSLAPSSDATAGPLTLTTAMVLSKILVRDPNGASRTDTLPTAALLVAAVPNAKVGDVLQLLIVNGADAAEVITIAAGTGGGFDANQTATSRVIGQNTSKLVHIRLTNVTPAAEAYLVYA